MSALRIQVGKSPADLAFCFLFKRQDSQKDSLLHDGQISKLRRLDWWERRNDVRYGTVTQVYRSRVPDTGTAVCLRFAGILDQSAAFPPLSLPVNHRRRFPVS